MSDYKRLEDGELWNDNVVDYAMSLWLERHLFSECDSMKLVVYSTWLFHSYLRNGYEGIQKTMREQPVFDFDTIVLPIHISEPLPGHWLAVVVCNPQYLFQKDGNRAFIFALDSVPCDREPLMISVLEWLYDAAEAEGREVVQNPKGKYLRAAATQDNEYDCGPYMVHNIIRFIKYRDTLVDHAITPFLTSETLAKIWRYDLAPCRRTSVLKRAKLAHERWLRERSILT